MPDQVDQGSMGLGVVLGVLLTIAGLLVSIAAMKFGGVFMLLGFGIAQVLWIGPACVYFYRKGQTDTIQGMLLIAGTAFLLNATCWGAVVLGRR